MFYLSAENWLSVTLWTRTLVPTAVLLVMRLEVLNKSLSYLSEVSAHTYIFRGVINDNLFLTVESEITDSPDNMTLVEGSDAVFTCVATARPRPSITWWVVQDGGSATMITSDATKYSITEMATGERVLNSTLAVSSTTPADAGAYICRANNPTEVPTEAEAQLTVLGMQVCVCLHY